MNQEIKKHLDAIKEICAEEGKDAMSVIESMMGESEAEGEEMEAPEMESEASMEDEDAKESESSKDGKKLLIIAALKKKRGMK